jgi:Outer membrane protein beta-barrel domain
MKKLILLNIIILLSLTSKGQISIGVSAGSNLSSMSVFLRDRSTFRINPVFGYNVNLNVEYKFKSNLSLWTGMSLTQKGFNQHIKYFYSPRFDTTADIHSTLIYLEIPVYLKFNTNIKNIDLFYGFGPYVSYGIHGSITTEITGRNNLVITEKMKWDKSYTYSDLINYYGYANLKRFDYGVGTMFGIKYRNIIAVASFKYGLHNVMWEYFQDEKMSNSSLSLSIGYIFNRQPKQVENNPK